MQRLLNEYSTDASHRTALTPRITREVDSFANTHAGPLTPRILHELEVAVADAAANERSARPNMSPRSVSARQAPPSQRSLLSPRWMSHERSTYSNPANRRAMHQPVTFNDGDMATSTPPSTPRTRAKYTSHMHATHVHPGESRHVEIRRIDANNPSEADHPFLGLHDPQRKERLAQETANAIGCTTDHFQPPPRTAYLSPRDRLGAQPSTMRDALRFDGPMHQTQCASHGTLIMQPPGEPCSCHEQSAVLACLALLMLNSPFSASRKQVPAAQMLVHTTSQTRAPCPTCPPGT